MKNPPMIFGPLGIALNRQTFKKPISQPQTNQQRLTSYLIKKAMLEVNSKAINNFALEVFV